MRVLLTTAFLGAALMAAPVLAQSTVNNAPGDTYRGKPGQSGLDQSTVGIKSAATAQPPEVMPEGQNASASQTLNPTLANGAPPVPHQAATGEAKPASATVPTGWAGTPQAWDAHAAACAKRYKSYDATTDSYAGSGGKTAKCAMSVK